MRPHQKEGVLFLYECVMGMKEGFEGQGAILADEMGLGKSLQTIALIWTLMSLFYFLIFYYYFFILYFLFIKFMQYLLFMILL